MTDERSKRISRRQIVQTAGGIAVISATGLAACGGDPEPAPQPPPAAAGQEPAPEPKPEPMAEAEPQPEPEPAAEAQPEPQPDPESLPKLTEDDEAAAALGYRNNAADVDTARYPNFQAGQQCRNCTLFEGGDSEWGPCPIFLGKRVNANGWCATYAPKV